MDVVMVASLIRTGMWCVVAIVGIFALRGLLQPLVNQELRERRKALREGQ